MSDYPEVRIIYHQNGEPQGIRDRGGFLLFFNRVTKYDDQEERYRRELAEKQKLADHLLLCLGDKQNKSK